MVTTAFKIETHPASQPKYVSESAQTFVGQRPRVLLIAHACNPELGSEAAVGWHSAVETAKTFDTWVICDEHWSGEGVRRHLKQHGEIPGLKFVFVRKNAFETFLKRVPGFYYYSYNLWQWRAFNTARRLHTNIGFQLAHQVTLCGYREPGYWWMLGVPFVWGPVGGTQNYPWRFLLEAGIRGGIKEGFRSLLNKAQLALSPRVRTAARKAAAVLAANSTNYDDLARVHGIKPTLLLETGLPRVTLLTRQRHDPPGPLRILWSGNLLPHKAPSLLIKAIAELPQTVSVDVRILGSGPLRPRLERLARRLRVADRLTWVGRLPHTQALEQYEWADVFAFTSLRDTSGNAALEALGAGVPVICLAHQGIGDVVTRDCGVAIPVTNPKEVITNFAAAFQSLAENPSERDRLSKGALARADQLLWSRHSERISTIYGQVLRDSTAKQTQSLAKAKGNGHDQASTVLAPERVGVSDSVTQSNLTTLEEPTLPGTSDAGQLRRLWMRARREVQTNVSSIRHGSLALIDQALVSGVSFATTILLGRLASPEELGLYSLGVTLVLLSAVTQDALISTPFTVLRHRLPENAQRTYAGSSLAYQFILAAVAILAIAIWAFISGLSSGTHLTPALWVVAGILPFALFREFGRRISVAHLRMGSAVGLDAGVAVLQLGGLMMLGLLGWAHATSAFAVIGLATAVASVLWFMKSRHWFDLRFDNLLPAWRRNWKFGRWVLAGRMMSQLNSDVLLIWLLTFALGRATVGVFAACTSIVFFANPFILGAGLILTPKIADAYSRGGRAQVRRAVSIATAGIASVFAIFVILLSVVGAEVMQLVYGSRYTGYESTLIVLAAAIGVGTLGMAAANGLLALERPDVNFRAAVQGAGVMLVSAWFLMRAWGLFGAACGLLLGQAIDSATRLIAFYRATASRSWRAQNAFPEPGT